MTFRPAFSTFVAMGLFATSSIFAQRTGEPRRLPPVPRQTAREIQLINHAEPLPGGHAETIAAGTHQPHATFDTGPHAHPSYFTGTPGYDAPFTGHTPNLVGGGTARRGFFFQYDHLFWNVTPPDITVIGDVPSERFVTVDGVTFFRSNSLDTSFLDRNQDDAERFEFGNTNGSEGWMASIMFGRNSQGTTATGVSYMPDDPNNLLSGYWDANNDGIDDDLNGNNIFGRSGQDISVPPDGIPEVGAPIDTGDLVTHLVTFGEFNVKNTFEMTSAEINRSLRKTANLECFYGIRYFDFKDLFAMGGSSSALGNASMRVLAANRIIGPQVGGRWNAAWDKIVLNLEGRFMFGFNNQTVHQNGLVGQGLTGAAGEPAALFETAAINRLEDDAFSPLGEFRVETVLPISRRAAFRAGYTGFFVGGISYASPKVTYQLPGFGLRNRESDETIYVSAFTLGFEYNR